MQRTYRPCRPTSWAPVRISDEPEALREAEAALDFQRRRADQAASEVAVLEHALLVLLRAVTPTGCLRPSSRDDVRVAIGLAPRGAER